MKTYLFTDLGEESPEKAFLLARLPCKVSVGAFLSSLVAANLYMTLDCHLVVFIVEDDKLYVMEKLENFKKDMKIKDQMVLLNYVKKGLIFDSTKEVRLYFDRNEDVEGFKTAFMKVLSLPQK